MVNPLSRVFLRFTESGTESILSLRADIVLAILPNTRGETSIYTEMLLDGDSRVFDVTETREEVLEALNKALAFQSKLMEKESRKK